MYNLVQCVLKQCKLTIKMKENDFEVLKFSCTIYREPKNGRFLFDFRKFFGEIGNNNTKCKWEGFFFSTYNANLAEKHLAKSTGKNKIST